MIQCKRCQLMIAGPNVPALLLEPEHRKAMEFQAIYPFMAQHIAKDHPDVMPLIATLVDQYALAILAKVFTAVDETSYAELHDRARCAAWATLNQEWNIFPGLVKP